MAGTGSQKPPKQLGLRHLWVMYGLLGEWVIGAAWRRRRWMFALWQKWEVLVFVAVNAGDRAGVDADADAGALAGDASILM